MPPRLSALIKPPFVLTGDDAADAVELRRLVAHEEAIAEREHRKGYHSLAYAATNVANRYRRLLAEVEGRLGA